MCVKTIDIIIIMNETSSLDSTRVIFAYFKEDINYTDFVLYDSTIYYCSCIL